MQQSDAFDISQAVSSYGLTSFDIWLLKEEISNDSSFFTFNGVCIQQTLSICTQFSVREVTVPVFLTASLCRTLPAVRLGHSFCHSIYSSC